MCIRGQASSAAIKNKLPTETLKTVTAVTANEITAKHITSVCVPISGLFFCPVTTVPVSIEL
ncbi:hypothetical protein A2154_04805 [Candidatus Gottesmanbacteria bacterium RBG_16_43_7]|uniref:Uncharacterized protein n=1 Tax=Candidatus Gottesmanbacteria bacterium RBG_16_43_7 TaxID=1798373 RepID=A0A1F5Z8G5_9BACT|nr:MAG: hypothetical protein A2154_04805 [Candidatus Gottesmanbacteria bacterium RBG_16_43_7]